MIKKGLVSILIVNWNQSGFLKDCFESISNQSYKNIEVIIVDNASNDGSQEIIQKQTKKYGFKFIPKKRNLGFSSGNNVALKHSKGEYVLLLNADTRFKKDMVGKLVEFLKMHPKAGVVQPKLVFMSNNNKLDNIGAYLTWTGIPYYFGLYKNANNSKYNKELKLYSTKGACMMIKRKVIDSIGFLDDYMFAYFEESDFCHRVWLSGYECWYEPKVVVEHFVGATFVKRDNLKTVYMGHRNRVRSFIKNFELITLVFILPIHAIFLLGVIFIEIVRGRFKKAAYIFFALLTNLVILPDTLKKRIYTQRNIRKISDKEISQYIFKNPRFSYYLHVGGDLKKYID